LAEKQRIEALGGVVSGVAAVVGGSEYGELNVDVAGDTLRFAAPHGLRTGQWVKYQANQASGGTVVGGLTDGMLYLVSVVDGQAIQLKTAAGSAAVDLTAAGSGTQSFSPVVEFWAGNVIHVDVSSDTILFDTAHGLASGTVVRYEAGSAPVGGLASGQSYTVEVVDAVALKLKSGGVVVDLTAAGVGQQWLRPVVEFAARNETVSGVDLAADTIRFTQKHYLETGDDLVYRTQGGTAIGGLKDFSYYAIKVDAWTIKLAASKTQARAGQAIDLTSQGTGTHTVAKSFNQYYEHLKLQRVSSGTIETNLSAGFGLHDGQMVYYEVGSGRNPLTGLVSGQTYFVKVVSEKKIKLAATAAALAAGKYASVTLDMNVAGTWRFRPYLTVQFGSGTLAVDVANDRIIFTSAHGLAAGDLVTYETGGNVAIGGLVNGATYKVSLVDVKTIQLKTLADAVVNLTSDSLGTHRLVKTGAAFEGSNRVRVDVAGDWMDVGAGSGLAVGDAVVYQKAAGGVIGGLADGQTYYVASLEGSRVKLSLASGGAVVDLTAAQAGTHRLIGLGAEFTAGNGLAAARQAVVLGWAGRLSQELGVPVTLTAGSAVVVTVLGAGQTAASARSAAVAQVVVSYQEKQQQTTKLLAGIDQGRAFLGCGYGTAAELGVKVTGARLGLVIWKTVDLGLAAGQSPVAVYALAGSGTGSVTGVPEVALTGTLGVRCNRTGGAVSESITVPGGTVAIVFTAAQGNQTLITGTGIVVALSRFASLAGGFAFEPSGSSDAAIRVGVSDLSATLAADTASLTLTAAAGGLWLTGTGMAARAVGTASLQNVAGVSLTAGMTLEINTTGVAVKQTIVTGPATSIDLDFTAERLTRVVGSATLQIAGFADVSGRFAFQKMGNEPYDIITVGATDVSAVLSAGGVSLSLTGGVGAMLMNRYGVAAKAAGAVALSGASGVSLAANLTLELNSTGREVYEVITTGPGTDYVLRLAAGSFQKVAGAAVVAVAGFASLSGSFEFQRAGTGAGQIITAGATGVSASLAAGTASLNLTDGSGALLVTSAGLAAKVSGTVALSGVTGVAMTASLALELNSTGAAVSQEIATSSSTSITLSYTQGTFQRVVGSASLAIGDYLAVSGEFAFYAVGVGAAQAIKAGATGVTATLTAGGVGAVLSSGTGAMRLDASGIAAVASGTAELVGVEGVTLTGTVALELNKTGHAVHETVQTGPGTSAAINLASGDWLSLSGSGALNLVDTLTLSAQFAFQRVLAGTEYVLTAGVSQASATLGVGAVGVSLANGTGGLLLKTSGLAAKAGGTVSVAGGGRGEPERDDDFGVEHAGGGGEPDGGVRRGFQRGAQLHGRQPAAADGHGDVRGGFPGVRGG
jgi:hypothetical protein